MKHRVAVPLAGLYSSIAVLSTILMIFSGCKPGNEAPTATDNASPGTVPASISASPNPIPAKGDGRTTISWNTGDGSVGQVWVSVNGEEPKLFAQEVKGSSVASWINAGETADFVLYAGVNREREIARVKVPHNK